MPRICIDGNLRFFYQQAGQGTDVVLVHGLTGNVAFWLMIDLLSPLVQDFRVTSYDLRGHGYSDTPREGYTSAAMATDLRNLHQSLRLGPAYMVGHSWGGVVALHTAALYPETVAGLVLSDPFIPGLRHLEARSNPWSGPLESSSGAQKHWPQFREQLTALGMKLEDVDGLNVAQMIKQMSELTPEAYDQLVQVFGRCGLEAPRPENDFDIGQLTEQLARLPASKRQQFSKELANTGAQRMARLAGTTCRHDVRSEAGLTLERIKQVRCPVLALYGEHSPFLATCRFLERQLPNCRAAFVPGAKHMAPFENSKGFAELVRKHLREMAGIEGSWYTPRTGERSAALPAATGETLLPQAEIL